MSLDELAKALGYNYVFRGVAKPVIQGLAALAETKDYLGGDTIVRQFDHNTDLFVLLEGEARIKAFSGDTIAEFGPGSVIGEMSLIDQQPRSATVVAVGMARVARIPSSALRGMLETDHQVAAVVMGNLCGVLTRRLRTMNVHVDALAAKSGAAKTR